MICNHKISTTQYDTKGLGKPQVCQNLNVNGFIISGDASFGIIACDFCLLDLCVLNAW